MAWWTYLLLGALVALIGVWLVSRLQPAPAQPPAEPPAPVRPPELERRLQLADDRYAAQRDAVQDRHDDEVGAHVVYLNKQTTDVQDDVVAANDVLLEQSKRMREP